MKSAVVRIVSVCLFSLMLTCIGFAKIDQSAIVGMWLFNEGDVAKDSSENGHDGEILGGAELVNGKFGKALEFDGVDDYVDFGNDENLKPQQITVTAWFNTRKLNSYGKIFQSGKDWSDCAGVLLRVHQDGYLQVVLARGPGNDVGFVNSPALSTDVWYHAALTFDGANLILYQNGEKVGSDTATTILYDNQPVRIGMQSDSITQPFDGFIDEVAVFNVALSDNDIGRIMTKGFEEGFFSVSPSGKLTTVWGQIKK